MIRVASLSQVGGHATNEDAFVVRPHPLDQDLCLCFVADGQGGRPGGARAAQLACETALVVALESSPRQLQKENEWHRMLQRADQAVKDDAAAGFTTLIGVSISRTKIVGASSGDSAVLSLSGGQVAELTADQRNNPPVGSGAADIKPFAANLSKGWRVVVMTDGVWKYVGWDAVIAAARAEGGRMLIDRLFESAIQRGGGHLQDDFTADVIESADALDESRSRLVE